MRWLGCHEVALPPILLMMPAPSNSGLLLVNADLWGPGNDFKGTCHHSCSFADCFQPTGLSSHVSAALQVPDWGHAIGAGEIRDAEGHCRGA